MEVLLTITNPDQPAAAGAVVLPGQEDKTVGLIVRAPDEPADVAFAKAMEAAAEIGGEIVSVIVRPDDWATVTEEDRDVTPFYVGVGDIGDLYGHSRQYASTITQKRNFPAPFCSVRATPLWTLIDVALWAESAKKKTGQRGRRGRTR
jgi:hypothetical protein